MPSSLHVSPPLGSSLRQVMLVCNISPDCQSTAETLSSLQFASRAAQVELGQVKKVGEQTPQSAKKTAAPRTPSTAPKGKSSPDSKR